MDGREGDEGLRSTLTWLLVEWANPAMPGKPAQTRPLTDAQQHREHPC